MLTVAGCRARQKRLLAVMKKRGWDCFVSANYRTAYYLTGVLCPSEVPVFVLLTRSGQCKLIAGASRDEHAADELIPLETYSIDRCLTDLAGDAAALLEEALGSAYSRFGMEAGTFPSSALIVGTMEDATQSLLALRKKKEADEIAEIRASLKLCKVAYDAAKRVIRPGLMEIEVHNAMYDAVMREAGTTVEFAGDFACGERCVRGGGKPTRNVLREGDLYILDLFPAPALYFGDVCRTFIVGEPSKTQLRAWSLVAKVLREAEAMVKPGVPARSVYEAVKKALAAAPGAKRSFWHHAGHGIGHHGHEAPRIIPGSHDVFEVGDVFTLEPGVYSTALQGGIRLEDNYVVTRNGVQNLFDYPLDLTK
ncbi:MAG: aminopeptidase P family protein [Bryobacterales bacterium]|nr:aminopeptidase P family protein [Bryobacterales bacterium]